VPQRLLVALLICLACLSCGRRPAQEPAPAARPAEPTAYEFLDSVIRSLGHAQMGMKLLQDASTQTDLVDLMTANQNAAIEIRMAESQLRPFAASQDSTRRSAVAAMFDACEMIQRSLAIQLAGYERIDSASTTEDLVGLKRQLSNAKVAYQQGSALLAEATILTFASVVVPASRDTGDHVALNMSDTERVELVTTADSLLGPEVRGTGDASGPLAAARLLRTALDKPWRVEK
jgi:hypothetical protein